MHIRHFVLGPEGSIREFSSEQAALIAAGTDRIPEFAGERVRYLQVSVDDVSETEYKIQTSGAAIRFDGEGRMVRDDHGFVRIPIWRPDAKPEDAAEFADYRRSADEGIFDYIRKANNEFPTGS